MILRKMALMGLDTLMLYTEDTYEIPKQPLFRLSARPVHRCSSCDELDAYAAALGIELVPCIQTLAHLERALHWPQIDPDAAGHRGYPDGGGSRKPTPASRTAASCRYARRRSAPGAYSYRHGRGLDRWGWEITGFKNGIVPVTSS